MAKLPVSEKRKAWVGNRKDQTLLGIPLSYNVSMQRKYQRMLTDLVKQMAAETKATVTKLFDSTTAQEFQESQVRAVAMDATLMSMVDKVMDALTEKFTRIFGDKATPYATKMIEQADKLSASTLAASLKQLSGGLTLKTDFMTADLQQVVKASISENVDLITSLPLAYLKDVKTAVYKSVTTGSGIKGLIPMVHRAGGISYKRARMIALDQTRKVYNNINKQRLLKRGVKKFKWLHSGGGRQPRKDHIAMNGNIYSFDDLPIIDRNTGERGIPGQAINCGCTMNPVIEFDEGEQDAA